MSPRVLRAKARVSIPEMARRLRIGVADVRTLEATRLRCWEIADLSAYLGALGLQLEPVAVTRDGAREVLS